MANKVVWSMAVQYYAAYLDNKSLGRAAFSKTVDQTPSSINSVLKAFKEGWIPHDDIEYLDWLKLNKEAENAESQPA